MLYVASRFSVVLRPNVFHGVRTAIRTQSTSRTTASVDVPIGGSGSIKLDISYPTQASRSRPSILVHFPPGPVISQSISSDILSRINYASFLTSTIIITVNYRLSAPSNTPSSLDTFRYPQPIHDSTIAFSHILTEVAPDVVSPQSSPLQPWDPKSKPRIALFGTHIGASLATMLALTHPNDIHSVTIADPLVDWVILDELLHPSHSSVSTPARPRRTSTANPSQDVEAMALAAKNLINLRTKLFPSPSTYFDPFASPTLFLRAPGRDTPRSHAEALGILNGDMNFAEYETEGDEMREAVGGSDGYQEVMSKQSAQAGDPAIHTQDSPDGLDSEDTRSRADHDTITEAIGTDSFSFGPYDDDVPAPSSSNSASSSSFMSPSPAFPPPSSSADTPPSPPSSMTSSTPKQVKRRKVLRRWPPLGNPDSVLLPYFHVFTSSPPRPSSDRSALVRTYYEPGLSALLSLQGKELVDLLRRACFYGREKGFGEERVSLESGDVFQQQKDRRLLGQGLRSIDGVAEGKDEKGEKEQRQEEPRDLMGQVLENVKRRLEGL